MEKLKQQLDDLLNRLEHADEVRSGLVRLISIYPFNEFEYVISQLLAANKLTLAEYNSIRNEYISRNKYQDLYEIAPRSFGEVWGHPYLKQLVPNLKAPLSQEYDFLLPPNIRVEVKASRVTDAKSKKAFAAKSLPSNSQAPFVMNFQQLKPRCCDVFVWMAVWRDIIKHWVIPSCEIERRYSPQHRGNVGEGQIHVRRNNIHSLDKYLTEPEEIEKAIEQEYDNEMRLRPEGCAKIKNLK
ncbi:MAG: hypothetical protein M3447_00775 [Acidobacteriota bacterium]|nr:hypothetical protein [Acidobacteriota bacterium]